MIKRILNDTFHRSQQHIIRTDKPDLKTILICITVAFSLSAIKYFGDTRFLIEVLHNCGLLSIADKIEHYTVFHKNAQLYKLIYWAGIIIVFYLLPPFLLIRFWFKENLSEYGLRIEGAFKDYKLYLLMLCVMIPLVLYFSGTKSFQQRYPFYDPATNESFYPNLFVWEIVYFVQFFALEFFFRGFMLHGTKQTFGFYSVFVMTIPYCMIHFGKPFPETIAAIIAGIVLGVLSLKSRSIWLGVLIHYSVAITMDLCSLYQKGWF